MLHPSLAEKAANLANDLTSIRQDREEEADKSLLSALAVESQHRLGRFLTGIEKYRAHPMRRDMPDMPVLEQIGSTALADYAPAATGRTPVLVIPSLVNRAYILDLDRENSFMRWLAAEEFHPYLVDWGMPGEDEADFDLSAYVQRLTGFIRILADQHGGPVPVVGYCMGGLLALAAGLACRDRVASLTLLATPWDFQSDGGRQAALLTTMMPMIRQAISLTGFLPTDCLQMFFTALDPLLGLRKFTKFADSDPEGRFVRSFVALEDWLNDGVPLVGPAALDCLQGWYMENRTANGNWLVDGNPVDPSLFDRPALALVPQGDRIVPPDSALALAGQLPQCEAVRLQAGHIGMMAGSRAASATWPLIGEFLRHHS